MSNDVDDHFYSKFTVEISLTDIFGYSTGRYFVASNFFLIYSMGIQTQSWLPKNHIGHLLIQGQLVICEQFKCLPSIQCIFLNFLWSCLDFVLIYSLHRDLMSSVIPKYLAVLAGCKCTPMVQKGLGSIFFVSKVDTRRFVYLNALFVSLLGNFTYCALEVSCSQVCRVVSKCDHDRVKFHRYVVYLEGLSTLACDMSALITIIK